MAQMKEQIKAPEKELSNEETANLPDAEFKKLKRDLQSLGTTWNIPITEL